MVHPDGVCMMKCRLCDYQNESATEGDRCPEHDSLLVDAEVLTQYAHDILLGQTIGDEFGIVDVLGVGGFGTVYRALQFLIKRPVALKVLHSQFYFDEGIRQRFYQEARAIGSLTDTTVVKLIRFGEQQPGTLRDGSPGFFFMAQEFIEGETLHKAIRRDGRFNAERSVHIGIQILRALADAHRYGIVHRDLKPANIMLTQDALGDEAVKVLDFGIAKVFDDGAQDDSETPVTMTGIMLGTPNYMSPEQIHNVNIQPATDLYAVGVILYELLTGTRPFQRANRRATLNAQRMDDVPPFPPDVTAPASVYSIIKKALLKEAKGRFQSAKEMADALRSAIEDPNFTIAEDTLESSIEYLSVPSVQAMSANVAQSVSGPISAGGHTTSGVRLQTGSTPVPTLEPSINEISEAGLEPSGATPSYLSEEDSTTRRYARPALVVAAAIVIISLAFGLRPGSQTETLPRETAKPAAPKVTVIPKKSKPIVTTEQTSDKPSTRTDTASPDKPNASRPLNHQHQPQRMPPGRRRQLTRLAQQLNLSKKNQTSTRRKKASRARARIENVAPVKQNGLVNRQKHQRKSPFRPNLSHRNLRR